MGWFRVIGTMGASIFIDLRDREGLTQVRFDPGGTQAPMKLGRAFLSEFLLAVRGEVVHHWGQCQSEYGHRRNRSSVNDVEVFNRADTSI